MEDERKENPTYFAIIPANVRYDSRLTMGAKMMFGEITCLSNKEGYCWASNNYFAKLYQVHTNTIQNWIHTLSDCEYIRLETTQHQVGRTRKIYMIPQSQPFVIAQSQ